MDPAAVGWHLDRRIPVAIIFSFLSVIVVQSATALWWASDVEHSVKNNSVAIVELKQKQRENDQDNRQVREQMIRLEGAINATNDLLKELKQQRREEEAERRRLERRTQPH